MARKSQIAGGPEMVKKEIVQAKPLSIVTKSEEKKIGRPVGFPETPESGK